MFSAERGGTKKCTKSCFFQKSAVNFGQKIVKNCEFFVKNYPFPADLWGVLITVQKIQKRVFSEFWLGNERQFFKSFFSKNFFVKFFSTWKHDVFLILWNFLKKMSNFFEQALDGQLRLGFCQKTAKILAKKSFK